MRICYQIDSFEILDFLDTDCLVGNFGVRERLFFVLLQAFVTLKKNWQTSSTEFTMKNYSDLSYFLMKTAKYIPNYKLMFPSFQKDIVPKHQ